MPRACHRQRRHKRFSELSRGGQAALLAAAALQLALLITAEADLQRRPASEIRGDRALWRAACLINFLGPLAYFRWGRRRPT
jgi:hypothetical protein